MSEKSRSIFLTIKVGLCMNILAVVVDLSNKEKINKIIFFKKKNFLFDLSGDNN